MLIKTQNLKSFKEHLGTLKAIAIDTETTGLKWWEDKLFSIIISDGTQEYYFNFNELTPGGPGELLDRSIIPYLLDGFSGLVFGANFKFDMHFLLNEGLDLLHPRFTIHCTQAIGRVEFNDHISYSLDSLGQLIGFKKSDEVKKYCDKNGLFEMLEVPGKKAKVRKRFFNRVPLDIMQRYAEMDARITFSLGLHQTASIIEQSRELVKKYNVIRATPYDILLQEMKLTKVLFKMERVGIKINREFTERACADSQQKCGEEKLKFYELTGMPFSVGPTTLVAAFDKLGLPYPKTAKGNPCFKEEVLADLPGELGNIIRSYRGHYQKANTYYGAYLSLADNSDCLHANVRQGGAATGRLSYAEPNLQNCTKVEKDDPESGDEFLVRRCFVPREGFYFVFLDFQAQEYRILLDYAEEMDMIEQVIAGMDVHQATANLMGVTRRQAKTINFMTIYGGGIALLAISLFDVTVTEEQLKKIQKLDMEGESASMIGTLLHLGYGEVIHNITQLGRALDMQNLYFEKLPNVKNFIKGVKETAKTRGFIFNFFGRKCYFKDKRFCYKAPNHIVQGLCGDIMKKCLIDVDHLLEPFKSRILISIHDELALEIAKDEMHLVPEIKNIMEGAYQHRYLPMKVEVDWSETNWQDKKKYKGDDDGREKEIPDPRF